MKEKINIAIMTAILVGAVMAADKYYRSLPTIINAWHIMPDSKGGYYAVKVKINQQDGKEIVQK